MDVAEWALAGDAVAFDFRILHGARGNHADRGGPYRAVCRR